MAKEKDWERNQKLRGGYYTPVSVADWLANWAIRSCHDRVLEPSCGDGAFLSSSISVLKSYQRNHAEIIGVEIDRHEAAKALCRVAGHRFVKVLSDDFFNWLGSNSPGTFDAVIGNPPFVRYQNFPEPSRSRAIRIMQTVGLRPNKLTNMWVPFVVAGVTLLRQGGRLAMVLPAELLQVSYAGQLRQLLADTFENITIFTCNEMFFERAEQEVLLLLADGKLAEPDGANMCNISLIETATVKKLLSTKPRQKQKESQTKFIKHESEKWLKYFLEKSEIELLRTLRNHSATTVLAEHASVDVGIVTGRNEFFVINQEQVEKHRLEEFVLPLIGRAAQLPGAILYKKEYKHLRKSGQPVFLLNLQESRGRQFGEGVRDLISYGESRGFHKGYKCRIRKHWYLVPSVWKPDCFFFRQIYDFPRVIVNKASATCTDTIHRMRCKSPSNHVAANLYTHLTAASAEIEGRSYGGGVLELEPSEAERLLMPKRLNGAMPIAESDSLVRRGRLCDVLEYNDHAVLQGSLGLGKKDCKMLKEIWSKMRDRRLSRRRV